MSTTPVINVVRYSALSLGVFYGFYHQRSITATQRTAAAKREYEHKQSLIAKAKAEYAKSKLPASSRPTESAAQDPMDPNFDMEAFFNDLANQKA